MLIWCLSIGDSGMMCKFLWCFSLVVRGCFSGRMVVLQLVEIRFFMVLLQFSLMCVCGFFLVLVNQVMVSWYICVVVLLKIMGLFISQFGLMVVGDFQVVGRKVIMWLLCQWVIWMFLEVVMGMVIRLMLSVFFCRCVMVLLDFMMLIFMLMLGQLFFSWCSMWGSRLIIILVEVFSCIWLILFFICFLVILSRLLVLCNRCCVWLIISVFSVVVCM